MTNEEYIEYVQSQNSQECKYLTQYLPLMSEHTITMLKMRTEYSLKKIIVPEIIKKGTILYRFLDKAPSAYKPGMYPNKGKNGRCNKNQNIYYCCKSMTGLKQEQNFKKVKGILIKSVTTEDIFCGKVIDPLQHTILRGRTKDETPNGFHGILASVNRDFTVTYDDTNKITDKVLEAYHDGLVYSSMNSIDTYIGDVFFECDEETGYSNIALTDIGFKKIKEYPPIVYWD